MPNLGAKRLEEETPFKRLREKSDATRVFSSVADPAVVGCGDQDDRDRRAFGLQLFLQIQAGHAFEVNVEQEADWRLRRRRRQKLLGGGVPRGREAAGAEQPAERLPLAGVVLNQNDKR